MKQRLGPDEMLGRQQSKRDITTETERDSERMLNNCSLKMIAEMSKCFVLFRITSCIPPQKYNIIISNGTKLHMVMIQS